MAGATPEWLQQGRGQLPRQAWSFATDAPLHALDMGRESGTVVAADQSGGLYWVNRQGRVKALTRTSHQIHLLTVADDGSSGAAILDDFTLAWFDESLQFRWTRELTDEAIGLAMTPLGTHVIATMASGLNVIYDADKRKVTSFESLRPLRFVKFLASEPAVIAAADYGFFARYSLQGELKWNERLWSTVNDLDVTGSGDQIVLAGLAHGLQVYDGDGNSKGSFVMDGTAHRVSSTFTTKRLAAATLEKQVAVFDGRGTLLWMAESPEEIVRLRMSPWGDWLIVGLADGHVLRLDQG